MSVKSPVLPAVGPFLLCIRVLSKCAGEGTTAKRVVSVFLTTSILRVRGEVKFSLTPSHALSWQLERHEYQPPQQ